MNNPFKFGTIVDGEYFTDRVAEQEKVREILASENHLILISPRRFGTSETSYHSLSFYPHHFNQSHDGWHRSFISAVNGWLHSVRGCIHTD